MSNMLDNMEKAENHHEKRSMLEDDEELFRRTGPAAAVRTVARVGGSALRASARRSAAARNTISHSLPRPQVHPHPVSHPPAEKKGFGNAKLFSAIVSTIYTSPLSFLMSV